MASELPRSGFSDVDHDADPVALIHELDLRNAQSFHLTYKQRAIALLDLHEGDQVLDVGCGTGDDLRMVASLLGPSGRATGIDASERMITEARTRHAGSALPLTFLIGETENLPFGDASFAGCLAIRTFQHLTDPEQALAEMIRVVRPGGWLVVVDPDHDTAIIDVPTRSLARKFLNFRADTIRNGGIAHHMPALFKAQGLLDVSVHPMTEVRTNYAEVEAASHYEGGISIAQETGVLTTEEADHLKHAMRAAAETDRFLSAMTYFLTAGRKP